jgi:hypothetical protein
MRCNFTVLLAMGALLLTAPSWAAEEAPYSAIVLEQGAEVRAGPGQRFYVTQQLEPGTQVEVYRRDVGDWLAIKPPEGSFSWIPQADLEMTEEPGIAEITSEEAKSWLGSRAERIKEHKSHVTLSRGERVEVLGKKQVEGADGKTELWLKIAPPAGEFRWVHTRQVRKAKSRELAAKDGLLPIGRRRKDPAFAAEPVEEPAAERPRVPRSSITLSDLREEKPEVAAKEEKETYPVRQIAHEEPVTETPNRSLSPDGFVPRRRQPSTSSAAPATPYRTAVKSTKGNPPAPTTPIVTASDRDVTRELEECDLQLSLILARDKSTWNFSTLKSRIERIVETASTPGDRGQARFMLDKIKRFEEAFDVQSLPAEKPAAPVASRDFRPYDGEGWLTAVKSSEKPVAPYALVDADGKRLCFVSPTPGLSVSSHLNKRVGLYGKRGLIPDLNVPHVLASKVVDLDRLR